MHDPVVVSMRERVRCLCRVSDALLDRQRSTFDEVRQRLSVHVLHRDEREFILLADFVHGDDVGMVECRSTARFAEKTRRRSVRVVGFRHEHFDRNRPTQHRVGGKEHSAHSAAAQRPLDPILAQSRARRQHVMCGLYECFTPVHVTGTCLAFRGA
jgi:hypothetical protein